MDDENDEDEDDNEEENEDDEKTAKDDNEGDSLDFVHLDSLLTVLGSSNRWVETVPKRFVTAVFISGQ